MPLSPAAREGLQVFERGWLSSNNVLLTAPDGDDAGAALIDSGHTVHAAQTVALLRHALGAAPLARLINTHLHSDHCGGNAAVQREWGCRISTPPGHFDAARRWDDTALSYRLTGQLCERFTPSDVLHPGATFSSGRRTWQVLAAAGHDPHSLIFFDAHDGVLISADALWENGFGVVFPELEGEAGFDEVARTLDLIETLDARWVIPGHGRPFDDVAGALARARERLAGQVADPARHARHGLRVLVKYHLMEMGGQERADFDRWLLGMPLMHTVWQRLGHPGGSVAAFGEQMLQELLRSGALRVEGSALVDA